MVTNYLQTFPCRHPAILIMQIDFSSHRKRTHTSMIYGEIFNFSSSTLIQIVLLIKYLRAVEINYASLLCSKLSQG